MYHVPDFSKIPRFVHTLQYKTYVNKQTKSWIGGASIIYASNMEGTSHLSLERSSWAERRSNSSSLYSSRKDTLILNSKFCTRSSSNRWVTHRGMIPARGSCRELSFAYIIYKQTDTVDYNC